MFPLVFSHRFRRNPAVEEEFEGDYYDQNPEWDADLPDIESESNDSEDGTAT